MRKIDLTNGYKSITANKLRSAITISLITMGISAMVAIKSSIRAIETHLTDTYRQMGSDITYIEGKKDSPLLLHQARQFAKEYNSPESIGLFGSGTFTACAEFQGNSTPPFCEICAVNKEYISISNYEIGEGRNFSSREISIGADCCIIGNSIAAELFSKNSPIGSKIEISGKKFLIIGKLEKGNDNSKGGIDNKILIPLHNTIFESKSHPTDYQIVIQEEKNYAEPLFRKIRTLSPGNKKDYNIERSEQLMEEFNGNISLVERAAAIISIVTLIGAAIGLMNIMLIQVGEKQREFGIRKAIGARNSEIKIQVLTEAVMLSLAGAVFGITFGIVISILITQYLECPFHLSWNAILYSIISCLCVGIFSGYIPAKKGAEESIVDSLKAR